MDHKQSLQYLIAMVGDTLARNLSQGGIESVTMPDFKTVDPDRFNRVAVIVDSHKYVLSFFVPSEVPIEARADDSGDIRAENPGYTSPPTFDVDYRVEKPGLHQLYLKNAIEELLVIQDFVNTMNDFSRVSASIFISHLWQEVQKEIMRDAAWFEAAALIHAKVDLTKYLHYGRDNDDGFLPKVQASRRWFDKPPGLYDAKLEEIMGQLYVVPAEEEKTDGEA